MSRLTELLRAARKADPQLGADLEKEVAALLKRRSFGLVFEQHQPEAVELPGRPVRRGDKVRVLPPRGEIKAGDPRLWRVERIERRDGALVGRLTELGGQEPESRVVLVDDLVVVAEFQDRIYPGLVETGRVVRGGIDKPFHSVINAENYHALELLTYTHRHSIDALYIDPPYNTGAKDWKYNNNYVESDDDYRHSKWLAFMERRLEIARDLLKPDDSVLIVTIDEKEYARLALLLEQTFPESRVQMVSSAINATGVIRAAEFTRTNEFIFVVTLGDARITPEVDDSASQELLWNLLQRREDASRRHGPIKRLDQFYPIYIDRKTGRIVKLGRSLGLEESRHDVPPVEGCEAVFPLKPDGTEMVWGLTPGSLQALVDKGFVRVTRGRGKFSVYYLTGGKVRDLQEGRAKVVGYRPDGSVIAVTEKGRAVMPTSQWNRESHNAQSHGTKLLSRLLPGRKFPFPKSLYAVEDVLRFFIKEKRDAVVLDFFSGSGTTAHAVMRLNRQDGGRRQCISVTNNEVSAEEHKALRERGLRPGDDEWESLGICDYITKPRIESAITGRTPDGEPIKGAYKFTDEFAMSEGLHENAVFFTLTYEDPLSIRHHRAFTRVAPMLWLKAGARGRIIDDLGESGWDVAEAYGVLKNIDQMSEFLTRVGDTNSVRTVFVVTDSDAAFQTACRDLPERVTSIRLYESYLHNFMINRRAGA